MKLSEIADRCGLERVFFPADAEVEWAYCGDLMSDVIGHARENSIWVTIQAHANSIGVACLREIPAIVFANGVPVEPEVVDKARREGVALLASGKDSFTLCAQLHALGLRSGRD